MENNCAKTSTKIFAETATPFGIASHPSKSATPLDSACFEKIKADIHIHSNYSMDSSATMESYCQKALLDGVNILCFTDHIECGQAYESFSVFDFKKQQDEIFRLQEKYPSIEVLWGAEFGEPHLYARQFDFVTKLPMDFLLGSVHFALDFLNQPKVSIQQMFDLHYEETLKLARFGGFDALAHLDFPRKFVGAEKSLSNPVLTKEILLALIKNDLALEVNTSTLRFGMTQPLPSFDVVEQFANLGGKKVTVSSDSHIATTLHSDIHQTIEKLPASLSTGYFRKRKFETL